MATKAKSQPDAQTVTIESLESNAVLLESQRDALELSEIQNLAVSAFDEAAAILFDAAERCKSPKMAPLVEAEL